MQPPLSFVDALSLGAHFAILVVLCLVVLLLLSVGGLPPPYFQGDRAAFRERSLLARLCIWTSHACVMLVTLPVQVFAECVDECKRRLSGPRGGHDRLQRRPFA